MTPEQEKLNQNMESLWSHLDSEMRNDDILANIIEDDEDYIDEYFDPDEFE